MHHFQWRFVITAASLLMLTVTVGCGGGDKQGNEQAVTLAGDRGTPRLDPHPRPAGASVISHASGIYGGRYVATVRMDPKTWNSLGANETSSTDITNGMLFEGMTGFNNKTHEIQRKKTKRIENKRNKTKTNENKRKQTITNERKRKQVCFSL